MSPELLDPDQFGFRDSRPTKESDCYALGMVMYEVLSGWAPFTSDKDIIIPRKITEGERPRRPQGAEAAWFTDSLWRAVELCWSHQPEMRPTIEAIQKLLEGILMPPPSRIYYGTAKIHSYDELYLTTNNPRMFLISSSEASGSPFA